MGRLWSCGFENQAGEGFNFNTNATIVSSGQRSGNYAMQVTSFASDARGVQKQLSTAQITVTYVRFYIKIATLPNVNTIIAKGSGASTLSASNQVGIRLNTDGTLNLVRGTNTNVSGASAALSTGTWYLVEILNDVTNASGSRVCTGRLNGTQFATHTTGTHTGTDYVSFGGGLESTTPAAVTTGDWVFDDIAVNDNSGSVQNSWPGEGKIVHLRPNAAGDANAWTAQAGGTAGTSNNYTRVNEEVADDATTNNRKDGTSGGSPQDLFNIDSTASKGIGSADVITLVQVGSKAGSSSTTVASGRDFKVSLKDTTTQVDSTIIDASQNGYFWHEDLGTAGSSGVYRLTSYTRPRDSAAWTPTELDSSQIGYREGNASTTVVNLTQVWLLVEYVPTVVTSQLARPQAIITNTGPWQTDTGATTNAAVVAAVNESVRSDTSYVQSPLGPSTSNVLEYLLDAVNAPGIAVSGTNYQVSYTYYKNLSGGVVDLTVSLRQGATQIASWTHSNIGTILQADQTLDQTMVDNITNWGDLRIRFVPNQVS